MHYPVCRERAVRRTPLTKGGGRRQRGERLRTGSKRRTVARGGYRMLKGASGREIKKDVGFHDCSFETDHKEGKSPRTEEKGRGGSVSGLPKSYLVNRLRSAQGYEYGRLRQKRERRFEESKRRGQR